MITGFELLMIVAIAAAGSFFAGLCLGRGKTEQPGTPEIGAEPEETKKELMKLEEQWQNLMNYSGKPQSGE